MDEINYFVGQKLREVRHIFNEGKKLSAEQFAYLMGETRDRIANYESGRAAVPVRLLYALYQRGINPVYLLSGEGDIFADNGAGREFRQRLESRDINIMDSLTGLRAAAGKIRR